jgi:prophage antirepressor-like protein
MQMDSNNLNKASDLVFNFINKAEKFDDQKVDVIIIKTNDGVEPWFKAKDVAVILGYLDPSKSIRDNIDIEDKSSLRVLLSTIGERKLDPKFNLNQLKTTYINESGLYSLILRSKLPAAKQFKKWITSELLPKIRKLGQEKYLKLIEEQNKLTLENSKLIEKTLENSKLIEEKNEILASKNRELNRLHLIHKELLSFKKRTERNEIVYIVSTSNYARQGIFKIGRTKKEMKFRTSSHNITHIKGDRVEVIREFKVHDSVLTEKVIHNKLRGIALDGEVEIFMCPYNLLESVVDLIINNDYGENEFVDKIIDAVYSLRKNEFNSLDWTINMPNVFELPKTMLLIENNQKVASFDMSNATEEQKHNFLKGCLEVYKHTVVEGDKVNNQIIWKEFQETIKKQLNVPKSKFRAGTWKLTLRDLAKQSGLDVIWRML